MNSNKKEPVVEDTEKAQFRSAIDQYDAEIGALGIEIAKADYEGHPELAAEFTFKKTELMVKRNEVVNLKFETQV